jgi:hypothetical protein
MAVQHPPEEARAAAYAAVEAHLLHFTPILREEVLHRLGVPSISWHEASTRFAALVHAEAAAGAGAPLCRAYADAFCEVARRLARERPDIRALSPLQPPWPERDDADTTSDAVLVIGEPVLPFQRGSAADALARLPPAAAYAAPDSGGATIEMMAVPAAALPFRASPSLLGEPAVLLTVEQYASLCAELTIAPAQIVSTLRAYGVHDERALERMNAAYARRFCNHPDERARWSDLYGRYVEWLRAGGAR